MTTFPPPVALTGDLAERDWSNNNHHIGTLTSIVLVHDFLCPWCWVALIQAQKLTREFGVTFDWRGAELFPPALNFTPGVPTPPDPNAPPAPKSRFDLFVENEGIVMPSPRPPFTSMHAALLASEFATVEHGAAKGEELITAIYQAFWERCENVSDHAVLAQIAQQVGIAPEPLLDAVSHERYAQNVLAFDDDAYAAGIRHVPTFIFGGEERLAEAPYTDLARATERFLIRAKKYKGK